MSDRRICRGLVFASLLSLAGVAGLLMEVPSTADGNGDISGSEAAESPTATIGNGTIETGVTSVEKRLLGGSDGDNEALGKSGNRLPVYVTSRVLGTNSKYTCEDLPENGDAPVGAVCNLSNMGCGLMDIVAPDGEGYLTSERVRVDTRADSEELLGFDCTARGGGGAPAEGSEPVVITITRSDFESMEVEPLVASAGPEDGWLPVNMVNVLYAESESQALATEVLGVPVSVRAVPVSYHWDLGDGNTITTTDAGEPYPSEAVSGTYRYEGWYDVTLTTTFSGQFSVAGGPWQDIDGTIEVASDPIPVYSKSLESRLVDGDVPVDENEDPWVPERTAETEGPQDPKATHRET